MAIGESEAWLQGKWGMAIGETDAWLYGNWEVLDNSAFILLPLFYRAWDNRSSGA